MNGDAPVQHVGSGEAYAAGAGSDAREIYASRAEAIKTHLFLLSPNNSGSTFVSHALGQCQAAFSLPREGQHVLGFAGPTTRGSPWSLIWAGGAQSEQLFADPAAYDWGRTKRAWYLQCQPASASAQVFITKSPPFLLIADELRAHFAATRFLIMVRNPYAMLEGILRRRRSMQSGQAEPVAAIAARHVIRCLELQIDNVQRHRDVAFSFTYEEMCANPLGIEHGISQLVPALADLDLRSPQKVKNLYNEPLRDMNYEQIARLTPEEISIASSIFLERPDVLSHFGYEPI